MKNVNITPATKKIADKAELYVEKDVFYEELSDGNEIEIDCICITEENSDLYVAYGISWDGSLYYITSPDFIEDLPAHINTSIELKNVVKYVAKFAL